MEATRADFRQTNREIADALQDLATALALTPIHREYPDQALEVPILAAGPEEVIRVAGLFGKVADMVHHKGKLQTSFKAYFGDNRNVYLHVFSVTK